MRRETVNKIRYVLEEWLPPALRDSRFMRALFRLYWGSFIDDLEQFRANITHLSPAEYKRVYDAMPRIQDQTDNSTACLEEIASCVTGAKVCDVGCGTGYLLQFLQARSKTDTEFTGVDFIIEPQARERYPSIRFVAAPIEQLPFPDRHFDTVVCTHVLEHILDIRGAIAELRRVCAKRLIVVVPLEREYRFTFNPHIHFFPYPHSFLRHIIPVPPSATSKVIGRDLLYVEEMGDPRESTRSRAS
ncbi:MAG TPA: methyltransferase domain-containing protein [Steroidobacter sp.]|jgi:ubiquinone/menaquinone biosynthesis C-methylase UbiE